MNLSTTTPQIPKMLREAAKAWKPKKAIRLSEWVHENVRLSPIWEATTGRYDVEQNPFWREILDAMIDSEVRQITVQKSTQIGGTLTLIAAIWGLSELDPSPAMVVGPDELYTIELRDRIYANGEASPALRSLVPRKKDRNTRYIDLGRSRAYLAWAGSAQRLRGRACKRVFRSEIDVYPDVTPKGGDPIKASAERVKRFPDSLIYDESSPDGDHSRVHQMYMHGHQAKWHVPCPHCGTWQELRFFPYKRGKYADCGGVAGYLDANGEILPLDKACNNAHYVCIKGCRVDQTDKNSMVRSGVWVGAHHPRRTSC